MVGNHWEFWLTNLSANSKFLLEDSGRLGVPVFFFVDQRHFVHDFRNHFHVVDFHALTYENRECFLHTLQCIVCIVKGFVGSVQ